jgi:hypothetical protein
MDITKIHTTFKNAINSLSSGKIKDSLEQAMSLANILQIGNYNEICTDLQTNYRYMLQYYVDGMPDPDRKRVYNKLVAKLYTILWEIREELMLRHSANYEYNQKRYFYSQKYYIQYNSLIFSFTDYYNEKQLLTENEIIDTEKIKTNRKEFEEHTLNLFSIFWFTTHYGNEEKEIFQQIIDNENIGYVEKSLLVSAITLNLWRMFDETKLMLLLNCCNSENQAVKQRALVGLCFVLARYNKFIPYFPTVRNRLVVMADDEKMVEYFKNIFIQIISTFETAQIAKRMHDEILPELMKIAPQIKNKMEAEDILNSDDWEEKNPEWQEMIENSSVGDKLQEISELQIEGADVYLSTFATLKSFSFFNEIHNWFLPFDPDNLAVSDLFDTNESTFLRAFTGHSGMCNSDKYSFCLSISQMPERQQNMLKGQLKDESEQLSEITKDESLLTPDIATKNLSKSYVHDLFRFFKLHPQHGDFADMFQMVLIMHKSYLFDILATNNTELKNAIAEYYFAKKHYQQALDLFTELQNEIEPTAKFFQKLGYAYQKTSLISNALEAYLKADVIQPDNLWTVRKIALCYRLQGNSKKALEYYKHVNFLEQNKISTLLRIGKCYEEMGNYSEANDLYVKMDAENENNPKIWRAIVWCGFAMENLTQADYFAQRILETQPEYQDYINAGHIAWCMKNNQQAADYYLKSIGIIKKWETFHNQIMEDKKYLLANGVDKDDFRLMLDELQYRTQGVEN